MRMNKSIVIGAAAIGMAFGNANPTNVLTGDKAFASYTNVRPGVWRHSTVNDLPKPNPAGSGRNAAMVVPRPESAWPKAPAGFKVELYATGLLNPRLIRRAPNGDLFVAETNGKGAITIFRGITADGKPKQTSTFVEGLNSPFGIAFYPPGPNPTHIYIGMTTSVVRFPYKNGDLKTVWPAGVQNAKPQYPTPTWDKR